MTDTPAKPDYKDTVFLPKTDFPMKAGLAQKEPAILAKWQADDVYGKLREAREGRTRFILHDGPPYANGDIHMGHALNKVLKDLVTRTQSLLGKDAPYVPGWDCHGLPIEWKIEEAYRKKKLDKDAVPAAEFRAECREYAAKWVAVQRAQFERLGIQGDWDDPYLTMKFEAEAAIVAELLKFAETGQLYRGAKPVMWSPVEKTALAEAEVEYEDIVSTQIDVAFEIVEAPNAPELVGAHAVIWTTTPWTIPVNQAIAYGSEIDYWLVVADVYRERTDSSDAFSKPAWAGKKFLVAYELLPQFKARLQADLKRLPNSGEYEVEVELSQMNSEDVVSGIEKTGEQTVQGNFVPREFGPDRKTSIFRDSDLAGTIALHPMHKLGGFFAKPRPFLDGSSFVTTEAGTGLVHMAPDHGEDDFLLCRENGLSPVFAVEGDGKYADDWAWLGGQGSVINKAFNSPEGPICSDLRAAGALLAASDDFNHSYPHSWRSKAKIIFRATPQWFIAMDVPVDRQVPRCADEAEIRAVQGNGETLRETALDAIERVRWVPERSKNRIRSMVEGRPDWVISRQRAWGVPIALYINDDGQYLRDDGVNARILAAFENAGADAWFTADHAALLGPDYSLDDWTPVTDILDVWFDSGSTHAFVIEARYGKGVRADLYLEGSDQHRGWFQSSLLESCGTRGRAPYDAVLTHGFALDGNGRKMSKSTGNVVDPLKVMDESGADILRMWVASTDTFDDVKVGKEVLSGASDSYRKLRNTFRYLLGALSDFDESERVAPADMPELERYILHRLAEVDAELRASVDGFQFSRYLRVLTTFAQDDLSAFFFDIRKDCLYCDVGPALPQGSAKRRAYRSVLDTLFHALVRYAAPVIPFTAEEIWQTRTPDSDSVHLLEWPEVDSAWRDEELATKWGRIIAAREAVVEEIEPMRREKIIRSSLEADVVYPFAELGLSSDEFAELCIVSVAEEGAAKITRTDNAKCGRCWRLLPEVTQDGALCDRCDSVLADT
ncbi:isoleucine--tRNA ligase [Sphingorhabdus soli]|uniref:Isoleucine--tRNA ligase n=1 Tax=Flavisphingopyxis soli TaxID=2601267 RepID=A0A5C6U590_9SPHN|nr:isoleucine--tRNA ligase [Sphingorhabdus soli]TXC67800.1 isoleucine--tRNA ligase [Sphingorhabdus soli]